MSSPWRVTLGNSFDDLHPQLRAYFDEIPRGMVGIGDGVFDRVGAPHAWMRMLIRVVADPDVLFPVWEKNVPFTVRNTPTTHAARPAVRAERVFSFVSGRSGSGQRTMRDLIVATAGGLVDILGSRRRFRALFDAYVIDGGLVLTSTRVAMRTGRKHVMFPRCLSPRVSLSERFCDEEDRQYVALSIEAPLIGKFYEYAGTFRYTITSEAL